MLSGQSAIAATITPTEQSGLISGNDKLTGNPSHVAATIAAFDALVTGYFAPGWTYDLIGKFNTSGASNNSTIDGITISGDGAVDAKTGSWSYAGGDTPYIVVYKGGPNYIAQFYQGGITGNMYDLDALGLMNGSGGGSATLSHLTLYGIDGTPLTSMPVPGAGLLLLAGIGGLAAMRRKS